MKRRVLVTLLLLVAGAIVNVAVAWLLLVYAPAVTQQSVGRFHPPTSGSQWGWDVLRQDSAANVRISAFARGTGSMLPPSPKEIQLFPSRTDWSLELDTMSSNAATAFASGVRGDPARPVIATQMFEACGWPMFALQAQWDGRNASVDHTKRWRGGISRTSVVPMSPSTNGVLLNELHVLPCGPMWPGFAINTLFYAAILWMLFAAPFALRRLRGGRRIKRGLCVKCAYPVGASEVCTECGAAVR